jgi:hypothetical protein
LASPTCWWPLNEARVEHLIHDPEVHYVEALGADDLLLPSPEAVGVGIEESRLTERIVERCLRTSARITPLEARATAALADASGIGRSCADEAVAARRARPARVVRSPSGKTHEPC